MAGLGFTGAGGGETLQNTGIKFIKSSEAVQTGLASSDTSVTSESKSALPWGAAAVSSKGPGSNSNSGASITRSASFSRPGSEDGRYFQPFVRSGETLTENIPRPQRPGRGGSSAKPNKNKTKPVPPVITIPKTPEAKPILTKEEYHAAMNSEEDPQLRKFRKLAYEVLSLKTARPNAKDKLHSAANKVPISIEFNTEPVFGFKNNNSFICYVFVDGVTAASGRGLKIKDSKTNAYEAALQKILMPHIRIVPVDPVSKELEASKEPFTSPPKPPSTVPLKKNTAKLPTTAAGSTDKPHSSKEIPSMHKETNMETACLKRRLDEVKPLEEFVIVEPLNPTDITPAHTLRRSADFNHMLLEYEYFYKGDAARCVCRIENQVMAEVNGPSKSASKNMAATAALKKLKEMCWVIKTKKDVDSNTKISKEDMLFELSEQSDTIISHDNIGNKLLRKMGWEGGGVGKYGSGIAEPVSLKSVLHREGLGLSATKGVTEEFQRRVKDVIEGYAASNHQEDLVFDWDFRLDERQVIHDECRRLNLSSKSHGKGRKRYLCVRRKRTSNELFDHIMSCGGETARYVLIPPGSGAGKMPRLASKSESNEAGADSEGQDQKDANIGNGLLPIPKGLGLLGDVPLPQGAAKISKKLPFMRKLLTLKLKPPENIHGNRMGDFNEEDYNSDMEGYENDMEGFHNGYSGYNSEMGGYNNEMGCFNNGMVGYSNEMGSYNNEMGCFSNGMGGFNNGMQGYNNDMGGFNNGMGGFQNEARNAGMEGYGYVHNSQGMNQNCNEGYGYRQDIGSQWGMQQHNEGYQQCGDYYQDMGYGNQVIGTQNMMNGVQGGMEANFQNSEQYNSGQIMQNMGAGMNTCGNWGQQFNKNIANQGNMQQNVNNFQGWGGVAQANNVQGGRGGMQGICMPNRGGPHRFQGTRMSHRGGHLMQGVRNSVQNMGPWQSQGMGNFR